MPSLTTDAHIHSEQGDRDDNVVSVGANMLVMNGSAVYDLARNNPISADWIRSKRLSE